MSMTVLVCDLCKWQVASSDPDAADALFDKHRCTPKEEQ